MLGILRKSTSVPTFLFILLTCAGCAGNSPVRGIAVATGFAAKENPSADFVSQSRAEVLDYKPVGVKPPDRGHAPLSKDELEKLKGNLDKRRTSNEAEAATARALGNTPMAQPPVIPPLE
ncbi:hypothetical protein [Pseudochelatococcus sp. G4_1912]|uniref:hypothetical protein n=1 Tax=Pseudochelatococcus sp. G4_1912 TaxID=3114288 RepID=UPI0039C5CFE1